MEEYCDCITKEYYYKAVVLNDPFLNTRFDAWVHLECGRPSLAKWTAHLTYCQECGEEWSSPIVSETACRDCLTAPYSDRPEIPWVDWGKIRDLCLTGLP